MKISLLTLIAVAFAVSLALADERRLLSVTELAFVNASPQRVWTLMKNFDSIAGWVTAVQRTKLTEGGNGQTGAIRKSTLKNGWEVVERLIAYDEAGMSYSYSLFDGPYPVSDYISHLSVRPDHTGKGSVIVWSANFCRKNTSSNAPDGEDDASLKAGLIDLYRSSLSQVKAQAEKD